MSIKHVKNIHIYHRPIGGVFTILNALQMYKDNEIYLINEINKGFIKSNINDSFFYFHQPKSHLLCLLYSIKYFNRRKMFCCVLHESSNYNFSKKFFFRSILTFFIRFLVIRLNLMFGVSILGVSHYVCNSYLVKENLISYLPFLYDRDNFSFSNKSEGLTIVLLRLGTVHVTFHRISIMYKLGLINSVLIVGEKDCVDDLKHSLKVFENLSICDESNIIPREDFLVYLSKSKFFISMFSHEGFGLSLFEALYYGSIVITDLSHGAPRQWLPSEIKKINHYIFTLRYFPDSRYLNLLMASIQSKINSFL